MLSGRYLFCAFFFLLPDRKRRRCNLSSLNQNFVKKNLVNFFSHLLDQRKKFNVKFTFKSGVCKMPTVESFQGSLFFCLCPVSTIVNLTTWQRKSPYSRKSSVTK